jgi:hypothetical protein
MATETNATAPAVETTPETELLTDAKKMSSWEEFLSHKRVRELQNVCAHATRVRQTGVPFVTFRKLFKNALSWKKLIATPLKPL